MNISPTERMQVAQAMDLNERFLYQCLTGRRSLGALDAVRIEDVSNRRVRRWHVRQHDWHLIWPEVVGTEGAPPVPEASTQPTGAAHAA